MRNTKSAFTLVELIVVITILAILGTIAFISLQGYSADARNSKRTSDIGNIQSALSLKQVEGVPLMSFIVSNSDQTLSGVTIGWSGGTSLTDYAAWSPSYAVLNIVEKDFKDPQWDNAYKLGGTTAAGWVFQITATLEKDGVDTALVNGVYTPRGSGSVSVISTDNKVITLAEASANFFKKGDTVITDASASGTLDFTDTIAKVSRDGVTVTLTSSGTNSLIQLSEPESLGLISGVDSDGNRVDTGAIVNEGTTYLGY